MTKMVKFDLHKIPQHYMITYTFKGNNKNIDTIRDNFTQQIKKFNHTKIDNTTYLIVSDKSIKGLFAHFKHIYNETLVEEQDLKFELGIFDGNDFYQIHLDKAYSWFYSK